jgi:hypothetical protein
MCRFQKYFLKNKKNYFNVFLNKKQFEYQQPPQSQTNPKLTQCNSFHHAQQKWQQPNINIHTGS